MAANAENRRCAPNRVSFSLLRPRHQIGKIEAEKVVTFDHIRIAFLDDCGQTLQRRVLGFLGVLRVNNRSVLPIRCYPKERCS